MTLDDRDLTEIQAAFKVELGEHCQTLTRVFLALEKEPERPLTRSRML